MKRGREENDSTVHWDLRHLEWHENQANAKNHYITYMKKVCDKPAFLKRFTEALKCRNFMGIMSEMEVALITQWLDHNKDYRSFFYMSNTNKGFFMRLTPLTFASKTLLYREHMRASALPQTDEKGVDRGEVFFFRDATQRAAREAIELWLCYAKRQSVCRDIRVYIARLAWKEYYLWMP